MPEYDAGKSKYSLLKETNLIKQKLRQKKLLPKISRIY
jgi:hypothetical protein